jgi:hypothetical protein
MPVQRSTSTYPLRAEQERVGSASFTRLAPSIPIRAEGVKVNASELCLMLRAGHGSKLDG